MKPIVSVFIRLIVTSLILGFLFLKINFSQVFSTIATCNIGLFLSAFLLFIFIYGLGLLRWQMLLHALDLRPPLRKIVIAFSGGLFFNLILPSTVGGDVARIYSLFTHTREGGKVAATVILDRLSGFLGLTFIAILSLCFGYRYIADATIAISIVLIACLFICIVLFLFSRRAANVLSRLLKLCHLHKVESIWAKIFNALSLFREKKMLLSKNFLISFFIQGLVIVIFYLIALSLGAKIQLIYFFIIVPIISVISTLPITIAGLGLRDASAVFFLSKVGISSNIAFSLSLLSFFLVAVIGVFGGIIYVLTLHTRRL